MYDYKRIRALAEKNDKAANLMVADLACGFAAGTDGISGPLAASRGLDAAEEILKQLEPDSTEDDD